MEHIDSLSILLVDDHAGVRRGVRRLLSDLQGALVVAEANSLRSAMDCLSAHRPHAVVLDLNLPDGNGLQLVRRIKGLPTAPLIIVLTNMSLPTIREACLGAGADYFLDKSQEFLMVREILDSTLRNSLSHPS